MRAARLAVPLVSVAALLFAAPSGADARPEEVRVRRDVADLSTKERREFIDAVLALKAAPSPYDSRLSWYDQFVAWHVTLSRCNPADPFADHAQLGHAGPVFLAWHRQYVLLFEEALRSVTGRDVTVPYWDWTDTASTESVFAPDFMGGDGNPDEGYAVTDGPFRRGQWRLNVQNGGVAFGTSRTAHLVRHFGGYPGVRLPAEDDIASALDVASFDVAPFDDSSDPARSFRNALEGWRSASPVATSTTACLPSGELVTAPAGEFALHNAVHMWVGGIAGTAATGAPVLGTMAVPQASPNDPVFFLHHANVDRLWARWQTMHDGRSHEPRASHSGNGADDLLEPFTAAGHPASPASVADIGQLGYRYDDVRPEPYCTIEETTA